MAIGRDSPSVWFAMVLPTRLTVVRRTLTVSRMRPSGLRTMPVPLRKRLSVAAAAPCGVRRRRTVVQVLLELAGIQPVVRQREVIA